MSTSKFTAIDGSRYGYGDIYEHQEGDGWERLAIGPERDHVDVLLSLIEEWSSPDYYMLYISIISHTGKEPGRYESPIVDYLTLKDFLVEYRELLEGFAGHHFWIGNPDGKELLIYDQHNIIFAYGQNERFEGKLLDRGFVAGQVRIPSPHGHSYPSNFVEREDELFRHFNWNYYELQEGDEYE